MPRGSAEDARPPRPALPARAGEDLEVVLVRELRVVDREPSLQILTTDLGEAPVGLGVDARHEEARDGGDVRRDRRPPRRAARARLTYASATAA